MTVAYISTYIFTGNNKKLQLASCYSRNYYTCFASLGAVLAKPTVPPAGKNIVGRRMLSLLCIICA